MSLRSSLKRCRAPRRGSHTSCSTPLQNILSNTLQNRTVPRFRALQRPQQSAIPTTLRSAVLCQRAQRRCVSDATDLPRDAFRSPMVPYDEVDDSGPLLDNAFVLDPAGETKGTVVWLTGGDDDSKAASTLFTMVASDSIRTVVPYAPKIPITIADDDEARAWFDLLEDQLEEYPDHPEDARGVAQSMTSIHELLDHECKRVGSEKVILAGFSHGGAMAIHAGLRYPLPLGGIVSVCGYALLTQTYEKKELWHANRDTPVLAIHGKRNSLIPRSYAKARYDKIQQAGVKLDYKEEYELGHYLNTESILKAQRWWLQRCGLTR